MSRIRGVIFDLDGTLVDSVPDIACAVDAMMRQLGLPGPGESRVREWVGNGAPRLVKRSLTGDMDGEPSTAAFERGYAIFLEAYRRNVLVSSRLYAGARELLENLRTAGLDLACVTNKPAEFTGPLLDGLGIASYFDVVLSGDSLPRKKPDPLPLQHVMECLSVGPDNIVMVGDSANDISAARAAGVSIVCVSYGYNHGQDIREAGADIVIDALDELPALIENF
ncbi:MAG: phosphoglycolate phosphatase [Gammaproteobacteria bacterium]|jgi:phosphoglycolate phosphatase